jgi:hypothetical protein
MSINPLAERHFHSEASMFQDLARLFRFLSDPGPKVPFSESRAICMFLQILVQSLKFIAVA